MLQFVFLLLWLLLRVLALPCKSLNGLISLSSIPCCLTRLLCPSASPLSSTSLCQCQLPTPDNVLLAESGLTDQPAVHPSTSASSLGSRAGPLLYSPSTLLVPTSTRTPPSGYAPGAGHLCAESMPQLAAQAFPVGPMNQPLSPGSRAGPSERAFPAVNEWPHG